MIQLQAGYTLDCVKEILGGSYNPEIVQGLLSQLSYFDLEINSNSPEFDNRNAEQVLSVAHNIISRGLPTRPSLWLENTILNRFNITEQDADLFEIGTIRQELKINETLLYKLFRALHIIDPDLRDSNIGKKNLITWENLGSRFEEDFLYKQLPTYASQMWVQVFESQREIENLLRFSTTTEDEVDKYINGTINVFNEQRLDFSLEFPYKINNQRGIVVEIDGSQHEEAKQRLIDNDRDNATEKAKWGRALRIRTSEWGNIERKINLIKQLEKEEYFKTLKQNFDEPLYFENEGLSGLELCLIPFAVARIQKTLIHLLLDGKLDINATEWNIAVIEQDIPCANLAIEDFKEQINSLFALKGEATKLPNINIFIDGNKRFLNSGFYSPSKIDRNKKYDLLIDISILQRSGLTTFENNISAQSKVLIRSAHAPKTNRSFRTTNLIAYKPLGKKDRVKNVFKENSTQVEILEKFVQNIFRKTGFRAGQIEIINRAIQGLSVIGLLPTGSGKSLTYQLTALLQPGMTIIIDPIKSLMKDQYDGLIKNGIDSAVYINSSLNQKQRKIALEKIKNAQTIFAFVSPERLQDNTFRKELLETSNLNNHYFSYCVIDEAHCVSEWGHDFRTSYLRLGDNARNYCLAKDMKQLPFFALTATASYDVLSDIQRELNIPDENAIVRLENLDRPEIQFKIIEVIADIEPENGMNWGNKQALGEAKQFQLTQQLKSIPKHYEEFSNDEVLINNAKQQFLKTTKKEHDIRLDNFKPQTFYNQKGKTNNAGLVFCPHRNWYFGVMDNASNLTQHLGNIKIGTFLGSDGVQERDHENEKNQLAFVNHDLDLLVATKAFGMGIDKPNIRYVVHLNYPSSIESYYQEAGRGGRDRKLAIGLILFNRQELSSSEIIETVTEDGDISEVVEQRRVSIDKDILQSFHRNNFKGIAKEKKLLAELLTEIKFPSNREINNLEDKIFDDLSTVVKLSLWKHPAGGADRLYLNTTIFGEKYGYIILSDTHLNYVPDLPLKPLSTEIADYIREIILTEKPIAMSAFTWLSQFTPSSTQPGIEKLLESSDTKEDFQIIIPFTNNIIETIAKYLTDNGFIFTESMVKEAQNFCNDKSEFISNLERQFQRANDRIRITIPETLKPRLTNLFTQIRNEEDTYKAIYRLSIIGVVDDYTVDYNSKTIAVQFTKKPQGFYTQKLKEYLQQYNSPESTDEMLERLPFYKGNSEIQKCLGFLIKFVYEETAIQRKAAIEAMEEACIIGLGENGGQEFKTFIDLYKNSKYARPQYLPKDTEKGLKADFSIVEKYMNLVSSEVGEINNFKHLRGAATRMLVQRPDNFVFILLKAFSIIILEKENENFIKEAQIDFINGFLKVQETTKEDILSIRQKVETYKSKVNEFDLESAENLEDVESALYLNLHTSWLSNFNNKFLNN